MASSALHVRGHDALDDAPYLLAYALQHLLHAERGKLQSDVFDRTSAPQSTGFDSELARRRAFGFGALLGEQLFGRY